MIMERVIVHKPDLYFFWSKAVGATGDGRVTKAQWADGMRTVLNLDLPWIMLAPSLVEFEGDGRIVYAKFLDRYTIAVREVDLAWMEGIIERACEKLFSACRTLEQAYSFFDVDARCVALSRRAAWHQQRLVGASCQAAAGASRLDLAHLPYSHLFSQCLLIYSPYIPFSLHSHPSPQLSLFVPCCPLSTVHCSGAIDLDEFERGLKKMDLGLGREQLVDLMNALDSDKDGRIQLSEFASRFQVVFSRVASKSSAAAGAGGGASAPSAGGAAGARAPRGSLPVGEALRAEALRSGMVSSPRRDSDAAPGFGGAAGGGDGDGSALDDWAQATLNRIGSALYTSGGFGSNVSAIFASIDSNGDGALSPEEFARAITSLHLEPPLTDAQIRRVFDSVDLNGSGSINYYEFVQCFRVADTAGSLAGGSSASGAGGSAGGAAGGAGAAPEPGAGGGAGGHRTWQRSVIDRVVATLFEYRLELVSAFKVRLVPRLAWDLSSYHNFPFSASLSFSRDFTANILRLYLWLVLPCCATLLCCFPVVLLQLFDVDGNGVITREEFRKGLQALTSLTGSPITDMQADELMRVLDRDGSGTIDYGEVSHRYS